MKKKSAKFREHPTRCFWVMQGL